MSRPSDVALPVVTLHVAFPAESSPTDRVAPVTPLPRSGRPAATSHDGAWPRARRPGRQNERNDLVMEHLGMADAIARRYHPRGQDWNDMRQVAYLGLVKAAERYDAGRSADFASFAVPTIAGELKRHLRDNGWAVRPPRALQELHHEVLRALPRIAQRLGRDPSAGELAESFGCDRSRILEALECGHGMNPLSLDVPARGADGDTLGEALGATSEELSRSELVQSMRSACRSLSGRERRILFLRFFHEKTQAQIADELGVTQVQVSRLLSKILTRLRRNLTGEDEAA